MRPPPGSVQPALSFGSEQARSVCPKFRQTSIIKEIEIYPLNKPRTMFVELLPGLPFCLLMHGVDLLQRDDAFSETGSTRTQVLSTAHVQRKSHAVR